ncbi:MAG: ThiF family adenylyltransferase [Nanohaloarchaea archaeon]|nr:ThiF family adenylyltransferase [Candidatus Nanohaloarchaea archaeon]
MYSRFKALQEFGETELKQLQNSKVAVIGLGATGSAIAEHLARHGVDLVLFDRDYLEENDVYSSNIYTPEECEKSLPKAVAAENYLEKFTEVESFNESLNPETVEKLEDVDLMVDGTDNMETRFLLNEFSKKTDTPWIYTSAIAEKGYSMFLDSKCFNCVFEQVSPGALDTCESAGILRETSTTAASISAEKAVKYLTDKPPKETLDTTDGQSFEIESHGCEVCEYKNFDTLNSKKKVSSVCGENKFQIEKDFGEEAYESVKEAGNIIAENEYLVRAKLDRREIVFFHSGRAIVEAEDRGHAESIISETIGV